MQQMIARMKNGGKVALLGIAPTAFPVDWNTVIFNMLTVKGIYGREMYETWYLAQSMILTGLDIASVITHRFNYTDYQEAFGIMRSGDSGKVVMTWVDE